MASLKQIRMNVAAARRARRTPRFSTRLREAREARGLTLDALARDLYVSEETIREIEAGEYEPSVVLAEQIAAMLDTSVESIFTAEAPRPPRDAQEEERVHLMLLRRGYPALITVAILCLFASWLLMQFSLTEKWSYGVFAVWVVLGLYSIAQPALVQGYRGYNRRLPKVESNRKSRILRALVSGLLFGGLMYFLDQPHRPGYFLLSGLLFAVYSYFFTNRTPVKQDPTQLSSR